MPKWVQNGSSGCPEVSNRFPTCCENTKSGPIVASRAPKGVPQELSTFLFFFFCDKLVHGLTLESAISRARHRASYSAAQVTLN